MGRALFDLLLASILAAAFFAASPAHAQSYGEDRPDCHRFEHRDVSVDTVLSDAGGWICSSDEWSSNKNATWLRFDLNESVNSASFAIFRNARFESITAFSVGAEGEIQQLRTYEQDALPLGRGPFFSVPLPASVGSPKQIIIKVDNPQLANTGSGTYLVSSIEQAGWSLGLTIIIAALGGLVVVPLLFNLSMFPILRRKFMLWHAAMTVGMLMALTMATGLAVAFYPFTVEELFLGFALGYVVIVASAGIFTIAFLENFALSTVTRRALIGSSLMLVIVSGGLALDVPLISELDRRFYMIGFVPVLITCIVAMAQAFKRGSVWVRYQVIGWAPAIACGVDLVATGLAFQTTTLLGTSAPFFAMGFEVLVTGLGVIHRLAQLRGSLDEAISEAKALERLSERDHLTGLHNRRAVDARFEELHQTGYETFAVLDLDHFKRVNDVAGHAVGDEVLKIVADVLRSDENSIAMRLGGEEFVLLMRGDDTIVRAEKLRQAIPVRVAREAAGLDQIVTASMGLVVIPRGAMPKAVFSDIYTHADRLLYEAKGLGRNRTVSEKLRAFRGRSNDRRKQAVA